MTAQVSTDWWAHSRRGMQTDVGCRVSLHGKRPIRPDDSGALFSASHQQGDPASAKMSHTRQLSAPWSPQAISMA